MNQRNLRVRFSAPAWCWVAAASLVSACATAEAEHDGAAATAACTLGSVDPSQPTAFAPLVDGDELELTRGYQGYLLVLLRLATTTAGPRRTALQLAAARDVGPVRESLHPGLGWEPLADGGARSEPFEVWLTPALVSEFAGRDGWVRVRALGKDGGVRCEVERKVRFVDRAICMHYDDGSLDCSADPVAGVDPLLPPADAAPLQQLLTLRAQSLALAGAPWPAQAAWPGYGLHALPTYLAVRDGKGKPVRGYLVGVAQPPAGAAPLAAAEFAGVLRYDAGLAQLWDGIDGATAVDVADAQALVVGVGPGEGSADDAAFGLRVGALALARLREVDAPWRMVQACGQASYPRVAEAIALLHLECAVLDEALLAADLQLRQARLHEWAAIRAAAIAASPLVGQRFRHYDNTLAAERFAALRLVSVGSADPAAAAVSAHRAALIVPTQVAIEAFDDAMQENGDLGAAALEVAARAGLDPQAAYEQAGTVQETILAAWGQPPAGAIAAAQARHDWQAMQSRAAAIAALPEAGVGFEP